MQSFAELLFVYGTLRRGTGHRMQAMLEDAAEFVSAATFRGRLFRVARYPGVVESDDPGDLVLGDVFRLRNTAVLRNLDRYEGCNPADPTAPYVREVREVRLASGATMLAWVYLYNRPTEPLERIVSGDFLAAIDD